MSILQALREYFRKLMFSGTDWRGRVKYLSDRVPDSSVWLGQVPSIDLVAVERALDMICDAFAIPKVQRYCLRPDDDLIDIYRSLVGPRNWDDMELEMLALSLQELPGPVLTEHEFQSIRTVGDFARKVAARCTGEDDAKMQFGIPL